jgi:hypothetical protein
MEPMAAKMATDVVAGVDGARGGYKTKQLRRWTGKMATDLVAGVEGARSGYIINELN